MKVEFISTRREEECGINTYTTEIESALETESTRHGVPLGELNPLPYLAEVKESFTSDADVIHIQHEYGIFGPASLLSWIVIPLLWISAKVNGKKVVTTFHSAWSENTVSPPLQPLKMLYVLVNNTMMSFVTDEAIFLSEETLDEFNPSPKNVHLVPHGIPKADPMSEGKARDTLDLPDETIVCLPGFARPEKGHEELVETAKERPDLTFVAGGPQEGKYVEWVENLRKDSPDNLVWVGVLDDQEWHALWNAMDVAWLPYNSVSQSGILNWCVAYDVPTITSDLEYFKNLESRYDFPKTAVKLPGDVEQITTGNMKEYRQENGMSEVIDVHMECYT